MFFFFACLVSACASNPYPNWQPTLQLSPNQQKAATFARADAWYRECHSAWFDTEKQSTLAKTHLVIDGSSDPEYFKKMTSKDPVSEELIGLLTKWQSMQSYCRGEFLTKISDQDPRLINVMISHWNRLDQRLLKAMKGEFKTVGALNEYGNQIAEIYRKERADIAAVLQSQLQREVEINQQNRLAAAQLVLSSWALTQQQIQQQHQQNQYLQNLMKPPSITNCYVIGASINCTTR